ncbi:MAG: YcfL family protein [Victivallales bacterium]|jgi:uncharacterized protein YcfL|nr:YcfL family protein [Victivallales bacterium]MBT7164831.1 YcfL family protein [Victivallales bacterium]MBT7298793.1 YcfL family protein [Victivallales bacterium]
MKTSRLLLLGCVALSGLLAGCRSVLSPPDPRVTVGPELRRALFVSRFLTQQNDAGFTQIQATLQNLRRRTLRLQVRVDWFDAKGVVQESLTSNWRNVSVTRQTEYALKVTAPNPQATDFRLYIHEAKRN